MHSIIYRLTIRSIAISSMLLVILGFFQKSSLAIDSADCNTSVRATGKLSNIDYLIAAINLASRPFAKNAALNTNLIEQMYRGK